MTRQEAEALVAGGLGRWDGSTLVMPARPLVRDSAAVLADDADPTRVSWPGWMRTRDGEWLRVPL